MTSTSFETSAVQMRDHVLIDAPAMRSGPDARVIAAMSDVTLLVMRDQPSNRRTAAVALKRLQGPAPSPRTHVPELDAVWETSILRCLERSPGGRFSNVEDVVHALVNETVIQPSTPARTKHIDVRIAPRRLAVLIGAVLLFALLIGALSIRHKLSPAGFKSRRSIASPGRARRPRRWRGPGR